MLEGDTNAGSPILGSGSPPSAVLTITANICWALTGYLPEVYAGTTHFLIEISQQHIRFSHFKVGGVITSILKVRKLRHGEVRLLS